VIGRGGGWGFGLVVGVIESLEFWDLGRGWERGFCLCCCAGVAAGERSWRCGCLGIGGGGRGKGCEGEGEGLLALRSAVVDEAYELLLEY